jgi:hypothetical protein
MSTCIPVVSIGGRTKHLIHAAGSRRQAEHACRKLARDYRVVQLITHPQGQPERSETLASWRDGRRVF